jgi:hypothetical protein
MVVTVSETRSTAAALGRCQGERQKRSSQKYTCSGCGCAAANASSALISWGSGVLAACTTYTVGGAT